MPAVSTHTGYRKRRQRSTHQPHLYHQLHPAHVQQHHPRPPQQLREDIHDEMDVLSVKQEVSKKFVLNHSLLENVTSKFFAVNDIIPPSSFPEAIIQGVKYSSNTTDDESNNKELKEREELIMKSKLSNLLPNDITFGDLKLMKLKLKMLEEEVESLKVEENSAFDFGAEFEYQLSMTDLLREKFGQSSGKEMHASHEKVIEDIIDKDYNGGKFDKSIKEVKVSRQFSQSSLLPTKVTASSMEEERRKQLELEQLLQQQQQQQQQQQLRQQGSAQSPLQGSPRQDNAFPTQPQLQQHMLQMGPQTQQQHYDMYSQQSFSPSNSIQNIPPNQPLPPPTFLSLQASPQISQKPPILQLVPSLQPQPLLLPPQQPNAAQSQQLPFPNPPLDTFGMFPLNEKDMFGENATDDILMDDATFNGLQSTLEDQIFFDHSLE